MILEEWDDDAFGKNLAKVLALLTIGLAIFLSVTTPIDKTLFFYLAASAIIVLIAAHTEKGIIEFQGFGNKQRLYVAVAVGLVIGSILGIAQRGGQLNLVLPTQALYLGDLSFLLANVIAPTLEPLFWRGFVFLTILALATSIIGKKSRALAVVVALLASAYLFGWYHVNVYYGQTGALEPTFMNISFAALFAIFFTLGNSVFKTLGLEMGWHFANNLFSQGYTLAQIWPTMILGIVVFVIIVEITNRVKL